MLTDFTISVPDTVLYDLQSRLAGTRFVHGSYAPSSWSTGTPTAAVEMLVRRWRDGYDWRATEDELNSFHHLRGEIDGTMVHTIHERGHGPAPLPLLLVHGWPDSVWRFHRLIPLLTDPGAHGADPRDAFHVVAPSIPGYGWSEPRTVHGGAFGFGDLFARLMTDLGYERYGAHGGDWGSSVLERLARSHVRSVVGLHLTDVPFAHALNPPSGLSRAEQRFIEQNQAFTQTVGAYAAIASTRPMTAAHALNDSPAGLAAWIVEKFEEWGNQAIPLDERFNPDELISHVMIYWITQTIATSLQPYHDFAAASAGRWIKEAALDKLGAGKTPTGFALFPHDIGRPPREWATRFFDVQRWSELPSGGHFGALEEPELLAADIRAFFRPLRTPRLTPAPSESAGSPAS